MLEAAATTAARSKKTHRAPKRSDLILPRWETPEPSGVRGSYGPAVRRWAKRQLGLTVDGWQGWAIDRLLRHDRIGDLIARIALLSTGRQNGKSVIVRVITGWFLDEGQFLPPFRGWTSILAAAHDSKQARLTYNSVGRDLADREDQTQKARISIYRGITVGNIDFDVVSNQPGSVRGWSAGLIDYDELLTARDWAFWEALGPTQSAQRSPLMLLTSTAGHTDSVVLRAFYDRLVRQATGAERADPTFYGAWWQSEDPDAGLDWDQIRRANPALGDRLTEQAIRSEYQILPADSWRRERLNHFVDKRADGAVHPALWAQCRARDPLRDCRGPFALGIDIALGGTRATIAVAGIREDGRIGVEVFRDLRPLADEPISSDRILAEVHRFSDPLAAVAYDRVSGAASAFARDAAESGLPWDGLGPGQMVDASMDVAEMIASGRLAVDDPLLDAQAPSVALRNVGSEGAFRYSRKASEEPVDAFMAAVLAAHACAYQAQKPAIY